MYSQDMLASIKKVEATRASRIGVEPRRMSAEEKDALLKEFHPDYRDVGFDTLRVGVNKGDKVPHELAALLQGNSKLFTSEPYGWYRSLQEQVQALADSLKARGIEPECRPLGPVLAIHLGTGSIGLSWITED